ncbi:probable E3 ubiquitin-protein ligase ZFP1 isoform X2 [Magnolia sinica]|nr:probable E3 ubiquitin-protein ligase ZFP1 isoform X2 [Magnolia sinica]XP_058095750.1 probable E3 ubiquitin-protein ligase ZFP1 isoform X2 [Magnolia sinica]XP_058095751.1 probable E3 ubiquitin-protein ligase ZFP1 isoform X2 [Magnolia sinica]XP_058095752.1 probable E3 ubiquitin-protein ligase ZFP1 isoform X2 [Magnolia sinica]XP_058095753.1 probable E3 ubiquitin-protein ligase ZFP1 isoform X2 [Magnolia sinica]XP_058095754.1 probable E3 ubiquitin-protein ligase ZFP1 isoform X2 [Magnolia sinica]
MAQRNMLCTRQAHDLEIEQGQTHLHPEPCILVRNMIDFPNPNIHPAIPASVNTRSLDSRHLSDHHDSTMFYGNQYNGLPHCHHPVGNLDLAGAGTSNFSYNPYMIPSSASRMCPMPLNHGSSDHMPSSSSHGIIGIGVEGYGRDNQFMDNVRGSCKRKNAEGVPGNYYYVSSSAGSSSSSLGIPLNTGLQQWEEPFEPGVGVLDAPAFPPAEYRGNGVLSINEGSQRCVRSRSSAISLQVEPTALAHHHNQLLQGSYMGRTFQPAGNAWVEQFGSNGGDGGSSNWNYAPAAPYFNGRSINGGPIETGSINPQGYQDAMSSRSSVNLLHPSSMHHHHPPPHMQGMRGGQSYSFHPQIPTPSYRHPTNNNMHHGIINPSRDGVESGSRYPRSLPSSGDHIYRPHRRVSQNAPDEVNGRMRLLSSEDVAILEFSGFYGVGNFVDRHRDMRLDIDDMSYEELLALEERIGDVNTGLSEESILKCLKTRTYVSPTTLPPPDQSTKMMQDNGTCIICQVEYEDKEKIGILDCGHDYHANCIKQWLVVKNICPICKTSALSMDQKEA